MMSPFWLSLSILALLGGVMVILTPRALEQLNVRLSKAFVSLDDLVLRHRYVVGVTLMVVGYLCFRLALLVPASAP